MRSEPPTPDEMYLLKLYIDRYKTNPRGYVVCSFCGEDLGVTDPHVGPRHWPSEKASAHWCSEIAEDIVRELTRQLRLTPEQAAGLDWSALAALREAHGVRNSVWHVTE